MHPSGIFLLFQLLLSLVVYCHYTNLFNLLCYDAGYTLSLYIPHKFFYIHIKSYYLEGFDELLYIFNGLLSLYNIKCALRPLYQ